MSEWIMILAVIWCVGLFAAGGTDLNGKGYKWLRRFILPAGLSGIALLFSTWWACLAYTVTLSAFLHLGYGSRCSWLKRALIFIGYGFSALWFGWTWWAVATPILLLVAFWLSNFKPSEKTMFWKAWEMLAGFLIAVTFINAVG